MLRHNLWYLISVASKSVEFLISVASKSVEFNQCQVKIYGSNSVLEFGSESVLTKKLWVLFIATMVLNQGYMLYLFRVERKFMDLDHGWVWD